MLADELGEGVVRLGLLHLDHVGHAHLAALELQFPIDQLPVDINPVVGRERIVDQHTDAREILLITHRRRLGDDRVLVDVLLDRQEQLVGIDRLDQVVGDLAADRLVHDALLLALRHHDNGRIGRDLLDGRQCLEPREARHVLVEENNVERLLATAVDRVLPADDGRHLVTLLPQKQHVRLQQLNLVVRPKYTVFLHLLLLIFITFMREDRPYRHPAASFYVDFLFFNG